MSECAHAVMGKMGGEGLQEGSNDGSSGALNSAFHNIQHSSAQLKTHSARARMFVL